MGLTLDDQTLNSKDSPFVAVKFDIYSNDWDPPKEHVGININSMRSFDNLTWLSDIKGGTINEAFISYESNTQNLSILFTGFLNGTIVQQHLYEIVDLRKYLPEWVTFGFSADTGVEYATHQINSWNFASKDLIETTINPSHRPELEPEFEPDPEHGEEKSHDKTCSGNGGWRVCFNLWVGLVLLCV